MFGHSLLTQDLKHLGNKSKSIESKLNELYVRDDELQTAHQQAKRNDDFGEDVVTKYKAFLSCRQELIVELDKHKIQVPWQLRMTIDDLEMTLKQRREKEGKSSFGTKTKEEKKEHTDPIQAPTEEASIAQSGRVMVAFLGPSLVALLIAMVWYRYNV